MREIKDIIRFKTKLAKLFMKITAKVILRSVSCFPFKMPRPTTTILSFSPKANVLNEYT